MSAKPVEYVEVDPARMAEASAQVEKCVNDWSERVARETGHPDLVAADVRAALLLWLLLETPHGRLLLSIKINEAQQSLADDKLSQLTSSRSPKKTVH